MENPIYGDLFKVFIMIIGILISCLASVVAFYLKDLRQDTKEKNKRLESLEKELPKEYVRREDWIGSTAGLSYRIEKLNKKIDNIYSLLKEGGNEAKRD